MVTLLNSREASTSETPQNRDNGKKLVRGGPYINGALYSPEVIEQLENQGKKIVLTKKYDLVAHAKAITEAKQNLAKYDKQMLELAKLETHLQSKTEFANCRTTIAMMLCFHMNGFCKTKKPLLNAQVGLNGTIRCNFVAHPPTIIIVLLLVMIASSISSVIHYYPCRIPMPFQMDAFALYIFQMKVWFLVAQCQCMAPISSKAFENKTITIRESCKHTTGNANILMLSSESMNTTTLHLVLVVGFSIIQKKH
uniref:Reverse transcriptase domain-containing protein n=1 Tax=Globodera pallida TaxID=36090 RepID=A0A183BXQ9_GLOPA